MDTMLRVIFSYILNAHDGFLLHAAGLVHRSYAFIFAGKSGAGKSTICRVWGNDCVVLNDDLVPVRSIEGSFRAYPSPFWGSYSPVRKDRVSGFSPYSINSIDLWQRRVKTFAERLSWDTAIRKTGAHVFYTGCERNFSERSLSHLAYLVRTVPVYAMSVPLTQDMWRCIPYET